MREEKRRQSAAIYKKTDSERYRWLDSLSDKQLRYSGNVDSAVDAFLSREQFISREKRVEKRGSSGLLSKGRSRAFDIIRHSPVRKLAAVLISFIILFVVIPSSLPLFYGNFDSDVNIVFDPSSVYVNGTMNITAAIPRYYNIVSVEANMSDYDIVRLEMVDNSTDVWVWQGIWQVPSYVSVGDYLARVVGVSEYDGVYSAMVEWRVISYDEVNMSDENMTSNQTVVAAGLNVSLWVDREFYLVNETILVQGNVSYNDSLINTSVGLLIVGPGVNLSIGLNVTDGEFSYQFIPAVIGRYTVQAMVSYENETVTEELSFSVQNLSLDNVSEALVSDLYVWDDTDYWVGYVGDLISFYANYSSGNLSIVNASCLISFDVRNWTMPTMIMNYSDGLYVYNRSFNASGTYEYRVWCSASGYENKSMVSECVVLRSEPGVFEPVSQIEVGRPVLWRQSFQGGENLTVNISGYAYNISVSGIISEDDIIVLEKNVSKSLREYNIDKRKHILAKGIKRLLKSIKRDPDELQSKQELYQLYSVLKDNISLEEILNETYEKIEQYISQFIIEDVEIQLLISNISDEFEITYLTDAPKIEEEQVGRKGKRVTVCSDIHYEDVFTYVSIVESPREHVKLYWVVDGSYELVRDVVYVDTNYNGLIDRVEWITPFLSNQTYEIVITKAEHLDENKEFISDIYDEVYRKDDVWSERVYHDEYIRVTFECNLTEKNDITFYARNNQSLDTIVEVFYYDSDEKITEFPIISQEDYYRVYLTGMDGSHQVFDLKVKNLDGIGSAYLEFDYIVDPDTKDPVDNNTANMDSSDPADVGNETNFANCQDQSPDSDYMNIQENNTGWSAHSEWLYVDGVNTSLTLLEWETEAGTAPYLDTVDGTSYIHEDKTSSMEEGWFDFLNTSETGSGFTVNFSFYCYGDDNDDGFDIYYDHGSGSTLLDNFVITQTGSYAWLTEDTTLGGLTATQVNNMRIMLDTTNGGGGDNRWVDCCRMGIARTDSINYEIDFEYNWSNADYDEDDEEVCFYVGSHTGNDNLNVSYWTGSGWSYLGEITGTGWTNLTATDLTDATYEIRVNGTVETSDTTQDDWDIDVIMLHTWSLEAPTIEGEVPANQSTGISIEPICNVTVNDSDSDTIDVYFYENTTSSWILQQQNSSVDVSSTAQNVIWNKYENASQYNTKYWWSVNVTDGSLWTNETYYFTTEALSTSIDSISPYEQTTSPLSITATGPSTLDNVTLWYRYSSDNSTWWNSSFTYRKKLTIDHNKVAGDLTNFPILVNITDANLSSKAQSDGDDIVFTNATGTKLNHEMERYTSGTGELIAWVNVTSLSGSTDTEIYMYYNNSICGSQQNVAGVWDSNYSMVQHLNESSGTIYDSTSNDYDGTNYDAVYNTSSKIDGGYNFWVDWASSIDVEQDVMDFERTDPFSITGWIKANVSGTDQTIFSKQGSGDPNYYGYGFSVSEAGNVLRILMRAGANPDAIIVTGSTDVADGNWHHVAMTYNGSSKASGVKLYVNGSLESMNTGQDGLSGTIKTSYNPSIGALNSATNRFRGGIDEVRVSNINRSADWINTTYNTTSSPSTFLSTGNEEAWMQWNNANNPDTDYASGGWNWSFDFPNSTGYYEFYSIGKKSGNTDETPPSSADAICYYNPPTAIVPVVITNASTGVEETNATLRGYLQNNGSADTTCGFRYGTTSGSYSENFSKGITAHQTEFSNNNGSLTKGQIYFYQAWANNSVGFANGTELTFLTKPDPPTGLTAQTNSSSVIYLTWTKVTEANTTYIERNTSDVSVWARGDGTMIYNGSGTNYEDTSLTEGVTYYYQAWSFANWTYDTTTLHQYSDNNASTSNTTNNPPTIDLVNPSPNGTTGVSILPSCSIWANDTDGDNLNVTWATNVSGSWVNKYTNTSETANTTVSYQYTDFDNYSKTYYWKVYVDDGEDNVSEWFYFTTEPISTSVDTITPYDVTSSTLTINATGPSNLDNVTLWYRYSLNNASWDGWVQNTTDTDSSWQWSFNFTTANGSGYYEFYSIGKKSGSPDETAPGSADAICRYIPFNVSPSTWDIGTINLSENTSTTGFYFNLTNEGNISLDVQINATNATNSTTGFKWNLTSTPAHNNFSLYYNKSGVGTWTQINITFDTFVTGLAVDGYQTFDLKIFMATTSDDLDPMSLRVTFKSVAS